MRVNRPEPVGAMPPADPLASVSFKQPWPNSSWRYRARVRDSQTLMADPDRLPQDPLLRWVGSKRASLARLLPVLVPFKGTYFEPFMGGGAVFFGLGPSSAVLGDANDDLMNVYQQLAAAAQEVALCLSRLVKEVPDYYDARTLYASATDPIDRAALLIYLNNTCFNGLYRTNRKNVFNVPKGTRPGNVPSRQRLLRIGQALRGATLISGDFAGTVKGAVAGDVVYLDPPYPSNRRTDGEYGYVQWGDPALQRLLETVDALTDEGVAVVMSYSAGAPILEARSTLTRLSTHAIRHQVAARNSHRRASDECIYVNSLATDLCESA